MDIKEKIFKNLKGLDDYPNIYFYITSSTSGVIRNLILSNRKIDIGDFIWEIIYFCL